MSWQYRRRIKIAPGIRLNFSKGGISTSVGVRGANVTFGKNGTYLNTGIPGTGLYSRRRIGRKKTDETIGARSIINTSFPHNRQENNTINETSPSLRDVKEHVDKVREAREGLKEEITSEKRKLQSLSKKLRSRNWIPKRWFISHTKLNAFSEEVSNSKKTLSALEAELEDSLVEIDIDTEKDLENQFEKVRESYRSLMTSNKIWDIIRVSKNYQLKSSAKSNVQREEVKFAFDEIDFISSSYPPFHLENSDGEDLFIFPAFILQINKIGEIILIDLHELHFDFRIQQFLEDNKSIPNDTQIVDYTWQKVNKNGGRDQRYSYNPQIPIVEYGAFRFWTSRGLDETYYVSNLEFAQIFSYEFKKYLSLLIQKDVPIQELYPNKTDINISKFDPLFKEVVELLVTKEYASTSFIQRCFNIGYNRAGSIMKELEEAGVVGPYLGAKPRQVLMSDIHKINFVGSFLHNDEGLSIEYYKLLSDFKPVLERIIQELQNNVVVKEQIKKIGIKDEEESFIKYCILYDLIQIVKVVSTKDVSGIVSDESFKGFILIVSDIWNSQKYLDQNYEGALKLSENNSYSKVVDSILKIGNKPNPIKVSTKDRTDLGHVENPFTFPVFIKNLNQTLFDRYVTLLYRFANIIAKADGKVTDEEGKILKKIFEWTHNPFINEEKKSLKISETSSQNESLDKTLKELNELIGLETVKSEVNSLINFIKIQKAREKSGLKTSAISYHIVFTGNPGTGKTTVARIIAKIYKQLGILSQGQLVETDRSGLIAQYVGQTAAKVNQTVDNALNGVLFIDEAYALTGSSKEDFGKEAVATLIKRMEDDRDKLVLILAGYTGEMEKFINTNPGFRSRFNRYIHFPDYKPRELLEIFELNCKKLDYILTERAQVKVTQIFESAYVHRDETFGNGRFARNIFEKVVENQANRIAEKGVLSKETLRRIEEEDIL